MLLNNITMLLRGFKMKLRTILKKGSWSGENTPGTAVKNSFYYVQSLGYFFCDQNYMVDRDSYNTFLLTYTIGGKGHLKYRGKSYTLEKGDIFLIDCLDQHYYATDNFDLWEFCWFHFNGCEIRNYFEHIYRNLGPAYKSGTDSIIFDRINKIHSLYKNKDLSLDIQSSCYIVEILTELLLKGITDNPDNSDIPEPINAVLVKIEKLYATPLNLDTLAKIACMSKYHLSRVFKKYTGYSPYEYILNYRLSESKEMLKTTNLTIREISERIGFQSPSHFIKIFKQYEHTTPMKFRNYWS